MDIRTYKDPVSLIVKASACLALNWLHCINTKMPSTSGVQIGQFHVSQFTQQKLIKHQYIPWRQYGSFIIHLFSMGKSYSPCLYVNKQLMENTANKCNSFKIIITKNCWRKRSAIFQLEEIRRRDLYRVIKTTLKYIFIMLIVNSQNYLTSAIFLVYNYTLKCAKWKRKD